MWVLYGELGGGAGDDSGGRFLLYDVYADESEAASCEYQHRQVKDAKWLTSPQVAIKDIGETCAGELLATGTALKASPYVFDLCFPSKLSSEDVHKAWEEAAGKTIEMKVIPKEGLAEFYGAVFPPAIAESYVEMNVALLPGGIILEDPSPTRETRHGKTELVEVFKQLLGA